MQAVNSHGRKTPVFRNRYRWHCSFRTEARKKLPREFTFKMSAPARESVRRGCGLIDKWDSEGFELDLEIGKGRIWLHLTDDQYRAIGGVVSVSFTVL